MVQKLKKIAKNVIINSVLFFLGRNFMPDLKYLEYLRKLDRIIIPEEFTYFVHNTQFGKNEKKN